LYINLGIAIAVFAGGLKIEAFAYPFDFILPKVTFLPQLLAYFWILVCTSATKFLDGHDGLAATISVIGFLSIASVSLFPNVYQPLIFLFALIWGCSTISFLFFNFPNASLYLGESGSEILGFMMGVLSILSGAKVATASTVIGWFILDVVVVLFLRFANKKPLFKADRTHLHHRLADLGLNKIQVLTIIALTSLTTAHTGLLFPTQYKIFILPLQLLFLILLLQVLKRNKLN
jgi:UDP-GlcNAc:undecaprenyl-phosphate GlcNAc-1-phosphate transferase